MSDKYKIDSHKLMYHPCRVSNWINGENIYPIYVEVALAGCCNHRCIFCALDYMGYIPNYMDEKILIPNLEEMYNKGIKSVMYAGEGEPLLNKNVASIVNKTKEIGIDVSLTSNGVLFDKEMANECLKSFSWARFSVNAGTNKTYSQVHSTKEEDFDKVLTNLQNAVEIKKRDNLSTTIGVQMLLIPENKNDAVIFAKKLKEIGVDYFSIKPFSQHPKSICSIDNNYDNDELYAIKEELNKIQTDDFKIIFRINAMNKLNDAKQYNVCHGMPFWSYIDTKGNVWACSAYLGEEKFSFGNIKESSFVEIWKGEKRRNFMKNIANMNIKECREICRLDEINIYLERLKDPKGHDNFI